jgi:hypothetical protein
MKIIFDVIDDQPIAVPTPPRPRQRAGLRPWQRFLLPYSMVVAGAMLTAPVWGSTWASGGPWYVFAAIALLIWLATAGVILTLAYLRGRL